MTNLYIGQPVRRVEDQRFVSGTGMYLDDINLPGLAYGVALYSPHAHAQVLSINTKVAAQCDGVLAVYTGADLAAENIPPIMVRSEVKNYDGTSQKNPARPVLAQGKVRFVGDAVAFVVAESAVAGRAAIDLIEVIG